MDDAPYETVTAMRRSTTCEQRRRIAGRAALPQRASGGEV
jgi:hypothetical protein